MLCFAWVRFQTLKSSELGLFVRVLFVGLFAASTWEGSEVVLKEERWRLEFCSLRAKTCECIQCVYIYVLKASSPEHHKQKQRGAVGGCLTDGEKGSTTKELTLKFLSSSSRTRNWALPPNSSGNQPNHEQPTPNDIDFKNNSQMIKASFATKTIIHALRLCSVFTAAEAVFSFWPIGASSEHHQL